MTNNLLENTNLNYAYLGIPTSLHTKAKTEYTVEAVEQESWLPAYRQALILYVNTRSELLVLVNDIKKQYSINTEDIDLDEYKNIIDPFIISQLIEKQNIINDCVAVLDRLTQEYGLKNLTHAEIVNQSYQELDNRFASNLAKELFQTMTGLPPSLIEVLADISSLPTDRQQQILQRTVKTLIRLDETTQSAFARIEPNKSIAELSTDRAIKQNLIN